MRDQRDPLMLGEAYFRLREKYPDASSTEISEMLRDIEVRDYDAEHIGPLEKYGDPRTLPTSTP